MNFWNSLTKPIIGLAPMDGLTDAAFRFINTEYGHPDVVITEFISVDGIAHAAEKLFMDFLYHEQERPVVAQVFGTDPDLFYVAGQIISALGFDGMDINMGCPAKSVSGRGAGAGLINNPKLAQQIILAARQGVQDYVKGNNNMSEKVQARVQATRIKLESLGVKFAEIREIPVSVKTRIGFSEVVIEQWLEQLLQVQPANITVHGRTLKQMYTGFADWNAIARGQKVVSGYNQGREDTQRVTYLGNGDVNSRQDFRKKLGQSGVDGVLVGRGSLGNPWIFDQLKGKRVEFTQAERIQIAITHAQKLVELKGANAFVQMRKHLGWYVKSFNNAASLRAKLMQTANVQEMQNIFRQHLDNSLVN